ncbi:elongation factor [Plasmodium yoelii yoelii]|uniref:Elongation factor n=1 Tax=Plasmodium yoelii yoelii TaxID=73239 RepID=A0AAF0AZI1_PLAYO|nr:elongation factor [Plasmodium yoelii yoelii]
MMNIYNNMTKSLKANCWSSFISLKIVDNNCFITHRKYISVLANELRSGNIFLHNDKYCEVTEQRQIKQGRLATTNMVSKIMAVLEMPKIERKIERKWAKMGQNREKIVFKNVRISLHR